MKFYLLLLFLVASQNALTSNLKIPLNFDSMITINNENDVISSGSMSYRNGDFIYTLTQPSNQIIASNKLHFFVQDNDFNQVIIYNNEKSFFLQELLNGKYETESFACPNVCYKVKPNDSSGFKDALISITDEVIDWIRILDIKDERIFIKFENFKIESTNINYVLPENYEIIKND